ncbi:MAG TPA: hypothetical protein DIW47_06480 [Bacteroidetes bacterium]|nr:hypothetical protein [Bacteroidota bacterium]
MISALNHRQQLSGNKLFVVLFFLIIGGIACSASRKAGYLPNKRPATDSVPQTQIPDKQKQEEEIKKQKYADVPAFVNDFHVALFLPFYVNQEFAPGSYNYQVVESVSDYYQGVLLALDKLKRDGIIVTLHVYDSRKDSMETVRLLSKPEMPSMDLIIGPLDPGSFLAASAFSKTHKIPLVAPFLMMDKDVIDNPFAFFCSPKLEAYGNRAATHLLEKKKTGTILYLTDNSKTDKAFKKGFIEAQKDKKLRVTERLLNGELNPKSLLVKGEDSLINYILIPSDKEILVNGALRAFREAEDEGYKLQVIGLDSWLDFRDPEIEHWNKMHALIATASSQSGVDSAYRAFYHAFRARYQIPPGDFALKGYDQMLFFGKALLTFGKHFPKYVLDTHFDAIGMDYYWNFNGKVVENKSVRLIYFHQYQFIPLK